MNYYIDNPTEENIQRLKIFLMEKEEDTYLKQAIPRYCARLFLSLGKEGIHILKELVKQTPGRIYPAAIIETLFVTSLRQQNDLRFINPELPLIKQPEITDVMVESAIKAVHELVNESLVDPDLFYDIIHVIYVQEQMSYRSPNDPSSFAKFVFNIFGESSIKINKKIIERFNEIIINPNIKEEDCQVFLKENPALIDPLAKEIIPKQKLGLEFITDFVVRKLNDEYIMVEIEKPSTPIFTKTNDFSSHFTHALGQVLDFQEWVESNIAYADKIMPSITSPIGLLVIGHNNQLNEFQKKKLRRFNINNHGKVKVITFDELLDNSYKLYSNMLS
ncbi:Shedu anti-phage system protein SduA domain-containing protein [Neobacillus sp. 3P2-tot-E-2]|uniref:Shedu anti-phage system protein SduA domain-containing protein n=1 Tax=Neobacillus sp. 3P2-tot-E-2 TaxID=3132212 RepID=UPI0039A3AE8E